MGQDNPALANGHPKKATLAISGIPNDADCRRFKKALENSGGGYYPEKIDVAFSKTIRPDRRIIVNLSGLEPALVPWITRVVQDALSECDYPRFEIIAVLARQ